MLTRGLFLIPTVVCLYGATVAHAGPIFKFTSTGNAAADAGFATAGARWASLFSDNVTINITARFTSLGAGVLGSASTTQCSYSYSSVYSALMTDAKSSDDATATANLQVSPAVSVLINRTSNSPTGPGSATPYLDNNGNNNNTSIVLTNANAKALGLMAADNSTVDAVITFGTAFSFDFDPTDGIKAGEYDFAGIATHELGHALGFISGVDVLDYNASLGGGPFQGSQFSDLSVLDLYRYSALSVQQGTGIVDLTVDAREKYFSIDGGATKLGQFSTGVVFGDGSQASHWKNSLGIGIMDPTTVSGELLGITSTDLRAFDVIGWDLNGTTATPEPASYVMLGSALIAGLAFWRSLRQTA